MSPQKLFRWVTSLVALLLLSGCNLKVKVLLYNNTDAPITVHDAQAGRSVSIAPHAVADVTSAFSVLPEIVQGQHTYRYLLPTTSVPAEYQGGDGFELRHRYEFAADHRVYILPAKALPSRQHPTQPAGFPLSLS